MAKAYKCEVCENLFEGHGKIESFKIVHTPKADRFTKYPKSIMINISYSKISQHDFDSNNFMYDQPVTEICTQCQKSLVTYYLKKLMEL